MGKILLLRFMEALFFERAERSQFNFQSFYPLMERSSANTESFCRAAHGTVMSPEVFCQPSPLLIAEPVVKLSVVKMAPRLRGRVEREIFDRLQHNSRRDCAVMLKGNRPLDDEIEFGDISPKGMSR